LTYDGLSGEALSARFTRFCGPLAERYALRLVHRSYDVRETTEPPTVISGERPYKIGKDTCDTPDVVISHPGEPALVEVYSGRIPLHARVTPNPQATQYVLEKMVISKLRQPQDRIGDLLTGGMKLPAVDDVSALRVWPVLLLAGEGMSLTPILWR
jgi:hypothetical protein